MRTLKVIAALLHYPDEALAEHVDVLLQALAAEGLLEPGELAAIGALLDELRGQELIDVQARYVETFDRGRARSLYLFEHVHGESRDRGQAMVELSHIYRQHGYAISARELPDYLPLYLEFLSMLPPPVALEKLAEIGDLVQHLHAQLAERRDTYAALLAPLLRLAGFASDDVGLRERIAAEPPDDTPAALDAVWMEAPVSFGAQGAAGCAGGSGGRPPAQPIEWRNRRVSTQPAKRRGGQ